MGRFLSPDNYVQEPFGTQNYNRYGYALNNPLVYNDPSGEMAEGGGEGFLEWAVYLTIGAVATSYNWLEDQGVFRGVNKFFNKNIKGPIDDVFDWIHGRNGNDASNFAAAEAAPGSVSIDPLIRPSFGVSPILTANGGGNSSSYCPDCDNQYIFPYAVIKGAYMAAQNFVSTYISVANGEISLQDSNLYQPDDVLSLGGRMSLGNGIPTMDKSTRNLFTDKYSSSQKFVVDHLGNSVVGQINIFPDQNVSLNNITGFEKIRISANQTGGNRPEGLLRFFNSEGRINVNLNFQTVESAHRFWNFYYLNTYNNTVNSLFRKYDRENGTDFYKRYNR